MIDESTRLKIARTIREYIARERISREEFARRAKVGKSTVDKVVTGISSEKTIVQIESQLGIKLLETIHDSGAAPEELGGYRWEDVKHYVGSYVFARPSLQGDLVIHAFPMEILWDDASSSLLLNEKPKSGTVRPQTAQLYIPRASMYVFILSNDKGWLKQVILSQINVYQSMKGIMLTMGHAFGNTYVPVALPIIMNKFDKVTDDMVGKIAPDSKIYDLYFQDLTAVENDQYAKWIRIPTK